jgi:hypothetical protein
MQHDGYEPEAENPHMGSRLDDFLKKDGSDGPGDTPALKAHTAQFCGLLRRASLGFTLTMPPGRIDGACAERNGPHLRALKE